MTRDVDTVHPVLQVQQSLKPITGTGNRFLVDLCVFLIFRVDFVIFIRDFSISGANFQVLTASPSLGRSIAAQGVKTPFTPTLHN